MTSKKQQLSLIFLVLVLFIALVLGLARKIIPEIDNISTLSSTSPNTQANRDENAVLVPNFILNNSNGENINFLDYKGSPIVLNFWDSSSETTKDDLALFQEIYLEYGSDVVFIFINSESSNLMTDSAVLSFLEENELKYINTHFDTYGEAVWLFGITTFPTTAFIDSEGYLISGIVGNATEESLKTHLDAIII